MTKLNQLLLLSLVATTAACSSKPQIIELDRGDASKPLAEPKTSMQVTGLATLEVAPDAADLTMTLTSEGGKPGIAAASVTAKEQALVAQLAKIGVEASDVKLSYLTLDPFYDPPVSEYASPKLHGYRASLTVTATTKAFGKIAGIMEAGADAGATSLSTQFRRTDLAELKKKVRDMALTAARDKAKQTAAALDIQLGAVVSVNESPAGMYNQTYFPQVANAMRAETAAAPVGVALGATLQPLTLEVTVGYQFAHA